MGATTSSPDQAPLASLSLLEAQQILLPKGSAQQKGDLEGRIQASFGVYALGSAPVLRVNALALLGALCCVSHEDGPGQSRALRVQRKAVALFALFDVDAHGTMPSMQLAAALACTSAGLAALLGLARYAEWRTPQSIRAHFAAALPAGDVSALDFALAAAKLLGNEPETFMQFMLLVDPAGAAAPTATPSTAPSGAQSGAPSEAPSGPPSGAPSGALSGAPLGAPSVDPAAVGPAPGLAPPDEAPAAAQPEKRKKKPIAADGAAALSPAAASGVSLESKAEQPVAASDPKAVLAAAKGAQPAAASDEAAPDDDDLATSSASRSHASVAEATFEPPAPGSTLTQPEKRKKVVKPIAADGAAAPSPGAALGAAPRAALENKAEQPVVAASEPGAPTVATAAPSNGPSTVPTAPPSAAPSAAATTQLLAGYRLAATKDAQLETPAAASDEAAPEDDLGAEPASRSHASVTEATFEPPAPDSTLEPPRPRPPEDLCDHVLLGSPTIAPDVSSTPRPQLAPLHLPPRDSSSQRARTADAPRPHADDASRPATSGATSDVEAGAFRRSPSADGRADLELRGRDEVVSAVERARAASRGAAASAGVQERQVSFSKGRDDAQLLDLERLRPNSQPPFQRELHMPPTTSGADVVISLAPDAIASVAPRAATPQPRSPRSATPQRRPPPQRRRYSDDDSGYPKPQLSAYEPPDARRGAQEPPHFDDHGFEPLPALESLSRPRTSTPVSVEAEFASGREAVDGNIDDASLSSSGRDARGRHVLDDDSISTIESAPLRRAAPQPGGYYLEPREACSHEKGTLRVSFGDIPGPASPGDEDDAPRGYGDADGIQGFDDYQARDLASEETLRSRGVGSVPGSGTDDSEQWGVPPSTPPPLKVRSWTTLDSEVLQDVSKVFFTGFSDGLDFAVPTNAAAAGIALELVSNPAHIGAVVAFWNGDALRRDSYTALFPEFARRGLRLAAWNDDGGSNASRELSTSWAGVGAVHDAVVALFNEASPRIHSAVSPPHRGDVRHFSQEAVSQAEALRFTGAKHVVCLGGGRDVVELLRLAPGDVQFHVIPAVRFVGDDLFEEAAILDFKGPESKRVQVYHLGL